jgi:hypothetical protein
MYFITCLVDVTTLNKQENDVRVGVLSRGLTCRPSAVVVQQFLRQVCETGGLYERLQALPYLFRASRFGKDSIN